MKALISLKFLDKPVGGTEETTKRPDDKRQKTKDKRQKTNDKNTKTLLLRAPLVAIGAQKQTKHASLT